jgi:hypothetical protein
LIKILENFLNRKLYLVFAFLVCLFAAYFLEKSNSSFEFEKSKLKNVQEVIFEKEAKTQKIFDTLVSLTSSPQFFQKINSQLGSQLGAFSSKDDISLFILENDTLRFWSDNKVPISNFLNGKIYKITNDYNDHVYVGSTCDTLSKNFSKNKSDSQYRKNPLYNLINVMIIICIIYIIN